MGRAARLKGKTLEERIDYAMKHKAMEQAELQRKIDERIKEEALAWQTMVWWQVEMSIERMERIEKWKSKQAMKRAALGALLAGTIYSTLGESYVGYNRHR